MSKVSIIIKREYLSRVRRRAFIVSTFLFPIFIILFIVGSVLIAVKSKELIKIALPSDNLFKSSLKSDSSSVIFQVDPTVNQSNFDEKGYSAFLKFTQDTIFIISRKQIGLETMDQVEHQLNKAYENTLLEERGIKKTVLDSVTKVSENAFAVKNKLVNTTGAEKEANTGLAYGIGFGSGLLIYITMFIFGAMVMRGVMEEKMNRIAEVMVSSVRPFQLMMGKIVGIAAVGLTQFLMWIVLIIILFSALQLFVSADTMHHIQDMQQNPAMSQNATVASNLMNAKAKIVGGAQWAVIIPCFFFYFLGGYLL
ncbi:MAG TPA: ABC transporter permease, partial [Chitinophagaceae bacterium]|nr:ABC transporter permease [Chitinophagaceae bacterium]